MQLPQPVDQALAPLLKAYPMDRMLASLVPTGPVSADAVRMVHEIAGDPAIASNPAIPAGLWLYVDELDRSHQISQQLKDSTGSFWHGIMHRREGDFWNAKYWFDRAGSHPAMSTIAGYDAFRFVDAVEAFANTRTGDETALVDLQRREWVALFAWCATRT